MEIFVGKGVLFSAIAFFVAEVGAQTIVGNSIFLRPYSSDTDSDQTIIDHNQFFPSNGYLTEWRIFISPWELSTQKQVYYIGLEVWDCSVGPSTCDFGPSYINRTTIALSSQYDSKVLYYPLLQPILVHSNNCIGYSVLSSMAPVSYNWNDNMSYPVCSFHRSLPSTRIVISRTYSIQAVFQPSHAVPSIYDVTMMRYHKQKSMSGLSGFAAGSLVTTARSSRLDCVSLCKRNICSSFEYDTTSKRCGLATDNSLEYAVAYT